jgi:hypothetical protein
MCRFQLYQRQHTVVMGVCFKAQEDKPYWQIHDTSLDREDRNYCVADFIWNEKRAGTMCACLNDLHEKGTLG